MRWSFFSFIWLLGGSTLIHAQLSPITKITLNFTADGSLPVVAEAKEQNGALVPSGDINLLESTKYVLQITLSDDASTDINAEILADANRYQFFFESSSNVFNGSPSSLDADNNGLPIGLATSMTTACVDGEGAGDSLRMALNDLMMSKSALSNIDSGDQILNISWVVSLSEDPGAPPCENEEEIITDVILKWIPNTSGDTVVARAQDPDGEGPQNLQILDDINLLESTDYTLHIEVRNEIEGEDITEEIREEDDEHMFFFAFTDGIFSDPNGDGNIDNRDDAVRYNDVDENDLPVGLSTSWTTAAAMAGGDFRLVLKHQPDLKSATSTSEDGGTDIDLIWKINSVVTSNRDFKVLNPAKLILTPNPVDDEIHLTLDAELPSHGAKVLIYHVSGQLMQVEPSFEPIIDVAHLTSGIYLVQYIHGRNLINKRFIKS